MSVPIHSLTCEQTETRVPTELRVPHDQSKSTYALKWISIPLQLLIADSVLEQTYSQYADDNNKKNQLILPYTTILYRSNVLLTNIYIYIVLRRVEIPLESERIHSCVCHFSDHVPQRSYIYIQKKKRILINCAGRPVDDDDYDECSRCACKFPLSNILLTRSTI